MNNKSTRREAINNWFFCILIRFEYKYDDSDELGKCFTYLWMWNFPLKSKINICYASCLHHLVICCVSFMRAFWECVCVCVFVLFLCNKWKHPLLNKLPTDGKKRLVTSNVINVLVRVAHFSSGHHFWCEFSGLFLHLLSFHFKLNRREVVLMLICSGVKITFK